MLRLAVLVSSFVALSVLGGACSKSGEGPSALRRNDSGCGELGRDFVPSADGGAGEAGESDRGGLPTSPAFSGAPLG